MADETKKPGGEEEFEDSGLGNLPPLSDFDSQAGGGSGEKRGPFDSGEEGGLPPLSDVDSEQTSDPFGMDSGGADTPPPDRRGFQDVAADSDFSPQTPEVGPGPDSNVDTPMFDSAFGGEDSGFGAGLGTPAPTQAMETPMFGDQGGEQGGGDFGFDEGAFGQGTPAPDFSPDTGAREPAGAAAGGYAAGGAFGGGGGAGGGGVQAAAPPPEPRRGGGGIVGVLVAALIAFIIGVVAAPFISPYLAFLPNPLATELEQSRQQVAMLEQRVARLDRMPDDVTITPAQLETLEQEIAAREAERTQLVNEVEALAEEAAERREDLAFVEQDLADRSEEFAMLEESFEDLQNQTAIVQARQRGLASEVERLTSLVGDLEEANARRIASKEALEHNLDRLLVQVREGLPLTPARYSHQQRLADVEMLRERVEQENTVTPELLQEYTDLYLRELEIANQEAYFFARMPVTDRLGYPTHKWAEALMLGNRAVYFRTLDGQNIGLYTNTGTVESPRWEIQENLDRNLRQGIESRIFAARTPGYEDQLQQLAQREADQVEGTAWQRAFGSL